MSLSGTELVTMIPQISSVFGEVEPEIIYTINRSDAHSDHRVIFEATMACTKSFRYPYIKRVLMYECISETEFAAALTEKVFIPNYFVDVSDYMDDKLEIMKVFASELRPHPFPRSLENIKALAHFRGASVGVNYAEAFQLLKYIDK
jgi:LmbE family N-acetylglucosaminyl deacetylase